MLKFCEVFNNTFGGPFVSCSFIPGKDKDCFCIAINGIKLVFDANLNQTAPEIAGNTYFGTTCGVGGMASPSVYPPHSIGT